MTLARFGAAFLALSSCALVASCGDDDGGPSLVDSGPDTGPAPPDAGPPCTGDGTPLGECMRFKCEVEKASARLCTGSGFRATFNCTGVEAFPPEYHTLLLSYFSSCAPELAGIEDAEVETTSGPTTIPACQILKCALEPLSTRMPDPMTIRAECAPVPAPECDFPDPPMM